MHALIKVMFIYAMIVSNFAYPQECIPPAPTVVIQGDGQRELCGGEYPDISWEGTLIIKKGTEVTFSGWVRFTGMNDGLLIIEEGAILNITTEELRPNGPIEIIGTLNANAGIDVIIGWFQVRQTGVVSTPYLKINTLSLPISGVEIAGTVHVANELEIFGPMVDETPVLTLSGCGYVVTRNFISHHENIVGGNGFLKILDSYVNDVPLTLSPGIVVEYLGTAPADFGLATLGPYSCTTVPIKYKPRSLKILKKTKK